MKDAAKRQEKRFEGFTLLELLVSMTILSLILLLLSKMLDTVLRTWTDGDARVETFQTARGALEIMTRELTPAVVDTRMQFAVIPGEKLALAGASNVAPNSPAILWMAPLGEAGDLRCVGYYLQRDDEKQFYRLKRIYIKPDNKDDYFPKMVNETNPRDPELRTSHKDAIWFTRNWDTEAFDEEDSANESVIVSTAADNVIAFWIQCLDLQGNPVPWLSNAPHNSSNKMIYNSAAFFQMSTTTPYDDGETTVFLAQTKQTMKANRVPAAVDVTVIVVDSGTLAKGFKIPSIEHTFLENGALDVAASIRRFNQALLKNNIKKGRAFTTRVKLLNGS
jgi:prepilin-type N-terminal cleavage/methylation domain-containing protein